MPELPPELPPEDAARFAALYDPILEEIRRRSAVAEAFLDKDVYRLLLATLWANVVTEPAESDLQEADLEPFHDYLNERAAEVLGGRDCIRDCFTWLLSTDGEQAMARTRIPARHRQFLEHFGRLMLDPDGLASHVSDLLGR